MDCWRMERGMETHVETLEDAIEFSAAPWFSLTEEFGAQSVGPEGHVTENQTVNEIVGGVAELLEGSDKGWLIE